MTNKYISFVDAFPLGKLFTGLIVVLCVLLLIFLRPIAAYCINVSGELKLFFIDAFFPLAVSIAAFGLAIIPIWDRENKRLSGRPKWLVIAMLITGFLSLIYAGSQYIAITDKKIYVASRLGRKEYSLKDIERVRIYESEITKRTGGKDKALIFSLILDGQEIDILPGGWIAVKKVYQSIKAEKIAVEVDLKNLEKKELIPDIQKVLE